MGTPRAEPAGLLLFSLPGEAARLDPRLRDAARALLPAPPVPFAEATHNATPELNFAEPKEAVPGEHVPCVVVTLAVRHRETGKEQR